jgi:hypothetical protein
MTAISTLNIDLPPKTSSASECMCVEKGNARKIHSQAHLLSCFGFSFLFGNRDKLVHWL